MKTAIAFGFLLFAVVLATCAADPIAVAMEFKQPMGDAVDKNGAKILFPFKKDLKAGGDDVNLYCGGFSPAGCSAFCYNSGYNYYLCDADYCWCFV